MADMREKLDNLCCGLDTLAVFRSLLSDDAIRTLHELLRESAEDNHFNIGKYSQFVSALYEENADFSRYLLNAVLEDENCYTWETAEGRKADSCIEEAVYNELRFLQELSRLTPAEASYGYYRIYPLPQWKNSDIDFMSEYKNYIENLRQQGECS